MVDERRRRATEHVRQQKLCDDVAAIRELLEQLVAQTKPKKPKRRR